MVLIKVRDILSIAFSFRELKLEAEVETPPKKLGFETTHKITERWPLFFFLMLVHGTQFLEPCVQPILVQAPIGSSSFPGTGSLSPKFFIFYYF